MPVFLLCLFVGVTASDVIDHLTSSPPPKQERRGQVVDFPGHKVTPKRDLGKDADVMRFREESDGS